MLYLEFTVPTGIMDSRVQNVPRVHPASYTGAVIIPETRFKRHRPVASTQLTGIPGFQARSSWATSWGGQRRLILLHTSSKEGTPWKRNHTSHISSVTTT